MQQMQNSKDMETMIDQLVELRELHDQLLLAVRSKQKNMRLGDMDGLQSWSAREKFLIDRITETDQQRRVLVDRLAQEMNLGEALTLTQLSEHLGEPHRSKLLALAGSIRHLAEQIHQVNQVNDAVTRGILDCFAQMHRRFAIEQCDIGLYDPKGQRKLVDRVSTLDAVG
jgi:flagellar biosynthesis/type III secretory pathway chaperone